MKAWGSIIIGVLLVLAGIVWILQGLDVLGQSGGMNGHRIWAVIGVIVAIIGVALVGVGARARRTPPAA
jgi:hypothetical protein